MAESSESVVVVGITAFGKSHQRCSRRLGVIRVDSLITVKAVVTFWAP